MKLDTEMLAAALGAAAISERRELPAANSADCEIVTCRMPDGCLRRLFCKFSPQDADPSSRARFGVAYEAQVYDQLLSAWGDGVPHLHGAFVDETAQAVGLALEYLDGATPLQQAPDPKAVLTAAARWIGRFHDWGETASVPEFLHRYDTEFYRHLIERAGYFTRSLHESHPWLPELCERCQRRLPALLPPATIIHGGYQADKILVHEGRSVPIDWESAALAAGEIDLANLTWGWDDDAAARCEREYCLARWPAGPHGDFALRLTAARVFLYLCRLGDLGEEGLEARVTDLEELRFLAEGLQ